MPIGIAAPDASEFGVFGAAAGTFGGYNFRTGLVKATGGKDLPIALLEDAIAIGGGLLIVSRFS